MPRWLRRRDYRVPPRALALRVRRESVLPESARARCGRRPRWGVPCVWRCTDGRPLASDREEVEEDGKDHETEGEGSVPEVIIFHFIVWPNTQQFKCYN